jgi:outer membrane protein OmpA-like peptidoglycan-associated protein
VSSSAGAGLAATTTTAAHSAAIRQYAIGEIHDEDLLLLAVDLDGLSVTDALTAYGAQDDPLLPMGELARLLDLNLNVSPTEGQIIGTLGQSQSAVTIDLANGVFRANGKAIELSPADVAVTGVEIYLRASAVQRILPVTIKVNIEELQLKLHALERLPIQARLDRLAALRDLQPDVDNNSNEPALRLPTPYRLITPPAFDISGQLGASVTGPRFSHSYDVRVANDFLYTGFQGFLGSDQNGQISSFRATFERHDAKGGLLGPINATSASAGDVFTPALPIGPRGASGRGFQFSTVPLEQTSVFDRIDLRGELPVGYDVELYINDILRSGQRTPTQGRYEFLNVPLVRGVNVIRIVTNGPRGERTEQTRIVNVGGGQLAKGKFTFAAGVVQQDVPLVDLSGTSSSDSRLVSSGPNPGAGSVRVSANAAYGLSEGVTLVAGAAVFPVVKDPAKPSITTSREMVTAGVRTSIMGAAVQVDAAADSARSGALAIGVAGQPFGVSTLVRQVFYSGAFIDETVATSTTERPSLSHTEINTDFNIRAMHNALLPLTLRGSLDIYADRSAVATMGFRASATARNILLSGGFDLQANSNPGSPTTTNTTGNLSVSTYYNFQWQLRASLDYNITPQFQVNALSITADRELGANQALRLGIGQGFGSGGATSFQIGDTLRTRYGDVSLSGDFTTPANTWSLGLSFATGLVFDPFAKRYLLTRPGPASSGSIAFQAFTDSNGDGVYDQGDKPAAGVTIDGGERKAVTDAKGHAMVTGVGSGASGRVQVGLDAIDDPYVQSPPHTLTFAPRPGLVIKAAYPLTSASEIIIHVVLRRENKLQGLSAVRVRLIPKKGAPLEGSTEFDGSAGFDNLSTGTYDFQLDPEQAERLHMHLAKPAQIVVPAGGGPLPDLTVEVVFGAASQQTVDPAPQDQPPPQPSTQASATPQSAPPASAPAPKAAAPAAPAAKVFVVYFAFNKDILTGDAQKVVQQAADYARTGSPTKVEVVGYTDTAGSAQYNLLLSERRAKTVAKALTAAGVPASILQVDWKGENDLAVRTGDGVKQPLNRRATIAINF